MVLLGTIVNSALIIAGAFLGRVLSNIPEKTKETVMGGIGLAVIVMGLQMGFESNNFLIVILSIVFGAILGEFFKLEDQLNNLGLWLEKKLGKILKSGGSISQGFVSATLIFVIGAMAILGALDSGIRGNHDILFTKGILDGFTALILTTTLGLGVLFSAVPVFLYQGLIALFATHINQMVPAALMDQFITEMTATGGVMILAIGLNMLGLTKIRVANLLPGILIVAIIVTLLHYMN
ncbi:DUF554 domain-containing protein [Niallia sp. Krafla_26]|uniref:DUF554 domain-containing protein n=1 Tax=Niallia sp. Krafla_26 TaxID=3064703 RepID=UPI003D17016D